MVWEVCVKLVAVVVLAVSEHVPRGVAGAVSSWRGAVLESEPFGLSLGKRHLRQSNKTRNTSNKRQFCILAARLLTSTSHTAEEMPTLGPAVKGMVPAPAVIGLFPNGATCRNPPWMKNMLSRLLSDWF